MFIWEWKDCTDEVVGIDFVGHLDFDHGAVRPLGRVSTSGTERAFGQSHMRTAPCLDQ